MRKPILINKQTRFCKGMVLTATGKKLVVNIDPRIVKDIQLHDFVELKKSAVTGELTVVDYYINFDVAASIHNSYQERYEDMILDERGVPL